MSDTARAHRAAGVRATAGRSRRGTVRRWVRRNKGVGRRTHVSLHVRDHRNVGVRDVVAAVRVREPGAGDPSERSRGPGSGRVGLSA
ncbi:hypothetical protein GCM10028784_22600 [Myceligenerans cantabricum]